MSLDTVISGFYAAAAGRVAWQMPFGDLAGLLGLWAVQVVGIDKRSTSLLFSAEGGPVSPQAAIDYIRHFHAINPRIAPAIATPADQWMHCHEHLDEQFVAADPFFQEFLIPHGGRYMSATKLLDTDESLFMLGLMRGNGSAPLGAADMPMLQQVKHHLSQAMAGLAHVRSAFAELGVSRQILGQMQYPMLLTDATRSLVYCNPAATALLAGNELIAGHGGNLTCRNKADEWAFSRAIQELLAPGGPPARQVVRLRRADGSICLAFLSVVRPQESMGLFGNAARVLVVLHDPAASRAVLDPFIVAECFDLTPAQARIAVQIAAGSNAKRIAQRSGVALSTVRTHIKRLMHKTGVDRQGDLVRLLLTLPPSAPQPAV
jgi:DNA-binding CsgD family transcriptional regulator/PAS domain-containing protein